MQDAVSKFMPEVADIMADELERTLEAHECSLDWNAPRTIRNIAIHYPARLITRFLLAEAYQILVNRVGRNFRYTCQQATMYELMRSDRSVHARLDVGERELALPTNERLLDVALYGPERVAREIAASMPQFAPADNADSPPAFRMSRLRSISSTLRLARQHLILISAFSARTRLLCLPSWKPAMPICWTTSPSRSTASSRRLSTICSATMICYHDCAASSGWKPPKPSEISTTLLVKPMLRQHDRNLHKPELRKALEVDLESVSDMEELMRVWDGLHNLETGITI
jgi:hypothetical protein